MLQGFGPLEATIVLLNGAGGLLVAATMKYADAIVKCFASALAIIVSTLLSVPLFDFRTNDTFLLGGACTVIATSLYAWAPAWTLPSLLNQGSPFLAGSRQAGSETELQIKETEPLFIPSEANLASVCSSEDAATEGGKSK